MRTRACIIAQHLRVYIYTQIRNMYKYRHTHIHTHTHIYTHTYIQAYIKFGPLRSICACTPCFCTTLVYTVSIYAYSMYMCVYTYVRAHAGFIDLTSYCKYASVFMYMCGWYVCVYLCMFVNTYVYICIHYDCMDSRRPISVCMYAYAYTSY